MPGHMNAILAPHPELQLDNQSGQRDPYFLDLSEPGAYTLAQDLVNEYLPLFPARYWHVGADEYVSNYAAYPQLLTYARAHYGASATAKDTYYGFINWVNDLVRAGGKTLRMWNDGIKPGDGTINPASNIVVEFWYNYGLTPQQLVTAVTPSPTSRGTPPTTCWAATSPTTPGPTRRGSPSCSRAAAPSPTRRATLGSNVHVWCDNPNAETEDQIAGRHQVHAAGAGAADLGIGETRGHVCGVAADRRRRGPLTRLADRHARRQPGPGQTGARLLRRDGELPGHQRRGRLLRLPLGQRLRRPVVDPGRPRRADRARPGRAALGGRLRSRLPDPALQRRHQLDHRLHHDHRRRGSGRPRPWRARDGTCA